MHLSFVSGNSAVKDHVAAFFSTLIGCSDRSVCGIDNGCCVLSIHQKTEMDFEYRIQLREGQLYPTPFRMAEGCYLVGIQGGSASTVGVLVVLQDGRTQFNQLISMQGPSGLAFTFHYIPAGQELSGLRVQAIGHTRGEELWVSATIFCKSVYSIINLYMDPLP